MVSVVLGNSLVRICFSSCARRSSGVVNQSISAPRWPWCCYRTAQAKHRHSGESACSRAFTVVIHAGQLFLGRNRLLERTELLLLAHGTIIFESRHLTFTLLLSEAAKLIQIRVCDRRNQLVLIPAEIGQLDHIGRRLDVFHILYHY